MRLQSLRYAEMFSVHQFSDPAIKHLPVKYYAIARKCPLGPELYSVLVLALAPADNTRAAFSFENGFKYTLRMLHKRSWEPLRSPQSIQQYLLGFSKSLRTIRPVPWRSMNLFRKTLGSHATPCFAGCTTGASGSKVHNFGGKWNSQPHGLACYVFYTLHDKNLNVFI